MQLKNDSAMEMREREMIFQVGSGSQAVPRPQRAHMLTEHYELVLEGDAQRDVIWDPMDHQQRTYNLHLEEVIGDRGLVLEESQHQEDQKYRSESP